MPQKAPGNYGYRWIKRASLRNAVLVSPRETVGRVSVTEVGETSRVTVN
jgi:hypothetical protein